MDLSTAIKTNDIVKLKIVLEKARENIKSESFRLWNLAFDKLINSGRLDSVPEIFSLRSAILQTQPSDRHLLDDVIRGHSLQLMGVLHGICCKQVRKINRHFRGMSVSGVAREWERDGCIVEYIWFILLITMQCACFLLCKLKI